MNVCVSTTGIELPDIHLICLGFQKPIDGGVRVISFTSQINISVEALLPD